MKRWVFALMGCLLLLCFTAPVYACSVYGNDAGLSVCALSINGLIDTAAAELVEPNGDGIVYQNGSSLKNADTATFAQATAEPALAVIESVESEVGFSASSLLVGFSGQSMGLQSITADGSGLHQHIMG